MEATKTSHSPAPWTIAAPEKTPRNFDFDILDANGDSLVLGLCPANKVAREGEVGPNAQLIAAAPDLLAFVKDYIEWRAASSIHDRTPEYGIAKALIERVEA